MRLYRQTVEDFRLYAGLDLTEDQMKVLEENAGLVSAKMRAVRIVSASNVSKRDLEQRLVHKGESADQARAAVEWMTELNLVDDQQTAQQLVEQCAAHGYGIARAKQKLYEKQIPKQYWAEALENYPDQTEAIVRYLRSKLGESPDQRQMKRTIDALLRRGHSWGEIRRGLAQIVDNANDFQEE